MAEARYGQRKTRVGVVVSDKMGKTVVVAVETFRRHRLYKKIVGRVKRYKAHDGENTCQVGDKVLIVETRPLSRDKRWRVAEILTAAALPQEEKAIIEEETGEELRELEEATAAAALAAAEAPLADEQPEAGAEEAEVSAVAEGAEAAVLEEVEAPAAAEAEEAPAIVEVAETAVVEEPPAAEQEESQSEEEPPAEEQPEEEETRES